MPAVQIWKPLGRILAAPLGLPWAATHASYPTALPLRERVRIYFSPRNGGGRSHLAALDVVLDGDRFEILSDIAGPLLSPGERGAFDADGVTVSCVIPDGGRLLAYYLGWTRGISVPFANFIGLAAAPDENGPFERLSAVPVVGRSEANPLTVGYPWVERTDREWRMWFGSHLAWGREGLEMEHVIKQAVSADGVVWRQDPAIVVGLDRTREHAEFALSRPTVLPADGRRLMWYARRSPDYSIGFCSQGDDAVWHRADRLVSFLDGDADWTGGSRAYPCVFEHRGAFYMLYNGAGYGRTGFGIARLVNPEALAGLDA